MKCYRVVSYVLPLNGDISTAEELKNTLQNNRYPEFQNVTDIQETDVGKWHDDHELNKAGANYDKFFPDNDAGPMDMFLKEEHARVRGIMLSEIKKNSDLQAENRRLKKELEDVAAFKEAMATIKATLK